MKYRFHLTLISEFKSLNFLTWMTKYLQLIKYLSITIIMQHKSGRQRYDNRQKLNHTRIFSIKFYLTWLVVINHRWNIGMSIIFYH